MKKLGKGVSSPWNHPALRSGTCVLRAGEAILKARRGTILLEKKLQTNNRQSLGLDEPCRAVSYGVKEAGCFVWGSGSRAYKSGIFSLLGSFWLRDTVMLHFKTVLNATR